MDIRPYNRTRARDYAKKWAMGRNPIFGDFSELGGDCTNFISQCVYAGACVMNGTPTTGWYYYSMASRAPAWTGVPYFYNFMTGNKGLGPFGAEVGPAELQVGDVIQLKLGGREFGHSLLVVGFDSQGYLISTHTYDAYNRSVSTYRYTDIRYIHIQGVRTQTGGAPDCFYRIMGN